MQYAEKIFVNKIKDNQHLLSVAQQVWESVHANDKQAVYHHLICSEANVNAIHGQASFSTSLTLAKVMRFEEHENLDLKFDCFAGDSLDKPFTSYVTPLNKNDKQLIKEFSDGCSLLHLACLIADTGMVELLLQYGANINASDSKGQTPLHYCIISRRSTIAKLLLMR